MRQSEGPCGGLGVRGIHGHRCVWLRGETSLRRSPLWHPGGQRDVWASPASPAPVAPRGQRDVWVAVKSPVSAWHTVQSPQSDQRKLALLPWSPGLVAFPRADRGAETL